MYKLLYQAPLLAPMLLALWVCQETPSPDPTPNIVDSKVNPIDEAVLVYVP